MSLASTSWVSIDRILINIGPRAWPTNLRSWDSASDLRLLSVRLCDTLPSPAAPDLAMLSWATDFSRLPPVPSPGGATEIRSSSRRVWNLRGTAEGSAPMGSHRDGPGLLANVIRSTRWAELQRLPVLVLVLMGDENQELKVRRPRYRFDI